jgi:hypothetical protein
MKKSLRYIPLLLLVLFVAQGCTKSVLAPDVPVAGSWTLNEAYQSTGNGWRAVSTGLEGGYSIFTTTARHNMMMDTI